MRAGDNPVNGIVIRSTPDHTTYDTVFSPPQDFSRPTLESAANIMDQEALQADLLTIENFFAHFQWGIISRMEEASAR